MVKSLSNRYGQKLLGSAKKSTTDAIKTASKRATQKATEATGDLICNKIADEITSVKNHLIIKPSKTPSNNNNNNNNNDQNNNDDDHVELTTHQKRYIYLQKKDSKLFMNYY